MELMSGVSYENVQEKNIDLPLNSEIVMMENKDIINGKINDNNDINIFKMIFNKNLIENDEEYSASFHSFSKDLKSGEIHYLVYEFVNINDDEDRFFSAHMIDIRTPDGMYNNDNNSCGTDYNETRSIYNHTCKSSSGGWSCPSCAFTYHACGEISGCKCTISSFGMCEPKFLDNYFAPQVYGLSYIYCLFYQLRVK